MKEIAIITGGDSAEYEISIQSANVVLRNLDSEKYVGTIIHVKNGKWTAIINGSHHKINKEDFSVEINSKKRYLIMYLWPCMAHLQKTGKFSLILMI